MLRALALPERLRPQQPHTYSSVCFVGGLTVEAGIRVASPADQKAMAI